VVYGGSVSNRSASGAVRSHSVQSACTMVAAPGSIGRPSRSASPAAPGRGPSCWPMTRGRLVRVRPAVNLDAAVAEPAPPASLALMSCRRRCHLATSPKSIDSPGVTASNAAESLSRGARVVATALRCPRPQQPGRAHAPPPSSAAHPPVRADLPGLAAPNRDDADYRRRLPSLAVGGLRPRTGVPPRMRPPLSGRW
jgi:hypothetical protein